ncbi:MAG: Rrf2 family transcriptional regulator [Phycisphaeraceae bacterium]|nr:Rrf2 family transcriptional regulator [Phycisphaeraceae bacterium]MCW5769926.1 Rrf2 family transcriptional regulator [Phycisphaeraceae bacterium]
MISQTTEYALRAVVHLAAHTETDPVRAKDIAESINVPTGYLQKILRMLCKHGVLTASRGSSGGFNLARPPESITVLDVLNASDGELPRINRCPLGLPCHADLCPLHRLLDAQMESIERVFAGTSLKDLINKEGGWVAIGQPQ